MTFEQQIQLGTLLLAAIALVVPGVYWCVKWRRNRRGLRLSVREVPAKFAHVRGVCAGGESPRIVSAGVWMHIQLYNDTPSPCIVTDIFCYEGNEQRRKVIGFPVREYQSRSGVDHVSSPLRVPWTLQPGAVVDCWVLAEVSIPTELGITLFKHLKPLGPNAAQGRAPGVDKLQKELNDSLRKKLAWTPFLGIIVGDISLVEFLVEAKLLIEDQGSVVVKSEYGLIPRDISSQLLENSPSCAPQTLELLKASHGEYVVELQLSNGTRLTERLPTHGKAFWYLKP